MRTRRRSSTRCSTRILPAGNTNYSLVGITPAVGEEARRQGQHRATSRASPPRRKKCASTVGDVRPACYAAIDRKLTTQIVPWIPYLWRDQVNILGPERDEVDVRPERRPVRLRARGGQQLGGRESTGRARRAARPAAGREDMALLHRTTAGLDGGRRPRRAAADVRGLLPHARGRSGAPLRRQVADGAVARARARAARPRPAVVRRSSESTRRTSSPVTSTAGPVSATRTSTTSRCSSTVEERAPRTLLLIAGRGVDLARRRRHRRRDLGREAPERSIDRVAMGFTLFGISSPVFWLGLMGLFIFWKKLDVDRRHRVRRADGRASPASSRT